jgi:hypothetical protein
MEWQKFFPKDELDPNESANTMSAADKTNSFSALRIVGLATVVVGVLSVGLYAGRELRVRYKFRRRTPSDFFSRAGDLNPGTEYGMGV